MEIKVASIVPVLISIGAIMIPDARAEIYKHVDQDGHITYSNAPMKGAKKLYLDSPAPRSRARMSAAGNFPSVDGKVQKQRDLTRRAILEEELSAEERLLAEARQALQEAKETPEILRINQVVPGKDGKPAVVTETRPNVARYEEKTRKLREQVSVHEKNIVALKKELVRLPAL